MINTITQNDLELHKKWLNYQEGGVRIITVAFANLSGADLSGANLSGADLSGANLRHANLSGVNLRRADLSGADLSGADLSGSDLSDADLSGANLRRADLSGANLRRANLSGADLSGANLSGANLSGANFSGADLSGANFSGANLSGANFSGADLSGANLSGANLSGANLRRANLRRADLRRADLSGADLSGAKNLFNCMQWMKDNFEHDDIGWIVYKTFGAYYTKDYWNIENGKYIEENVNPTVTDDCGCGINFATLAWIKNDTSARNLPVWRCRINWMDSCSIVVPWNTDGKARCGRMQLLEVVK